MPNAIIAIAIAGIILPSGIGKIRISDKNIISRARKYIANPELKKLNLGLINFSSCFTKGSDFSIANFRCLV